MRKVDLLIIADKGKNQAKSQGDSFIGVDDSFAAINRFLIKKFYNIGKS